jgi:hypothetical protein
MRLEFTPRARCQSGRTAAGPELVEGPRCNDSRLNVLTSDSIVKEPVFAFCVKIANRRSKISNSLGLFSSAHLAHPDSLESGLPMLPVRQHQRPPFSHKISSRQIFLFFFVPSLLREKLPFIRARQF